VIYPQAVKKSNNAGPTMPAPIAQGVRGMGGGGLPGADMSATQTAIINGRPTRVRIQGDGPPILLLNGLTRPLESWEAFAAALPGRTLISFDAPGIGGSPSAALSMSALAGLAVAVLDWAGVEQADVLGFSHGGAVAQQVAIQAPARVSRLILASTCCGIGSIPSKLGSLSHLRKPMEASWRRPSGVGMLWRALAVASWSSVPFLGWLKVPALVVCGQWDQVVRPENSRYLAGRIGGADLVMLPAGHDLQRPNVVGELAAVVERFLSREPAAGNEVTQLAA
jgi:pimeloyl-ACP methyl ester carboxylesterase